MPDLNSLRILVTRPAEQATHLIDLIKQAGGEPIYLPLLKIVPIAENNINCLNNVDIAIFISANAVEYTLQKIILPPQIMLFAVGQATKKALENKGFLPQSAPPPFNSETLLSLPTLQRVANKKIIIFRGENGRETLADELRKRGAFVDYHNVYRRVCLDIILPTQLPDIITITSGELLQHLQFYIQKQTAWQKIPIFILSKRIYAIAIEIGVVNPLHIAQEASDEALLNSIIEWQHKRLFA